MAEQLALAQAYREYTAERLPYLVIELDAVAEGAGVDPIRLFAASIEEIWDWEDPPAPAERSRLTSERGRCSDLVIGPPATASGSVMVAHNNDLDAYDEPNMIAIEWNVDGELRKRMSGIGAWSSVVW